MSDGRARTLLGLVIEAERVIVAHGAMKNKSFPTSLEQLSLEEEHQWQVVIDESFHFESFFDGLFEDIFRYNPNIENIGVSCYGPFNKYEPFPPDGIKHGIAYTSLGKTSGKRHLSNRPIKSDLLQCIKRARKKLELGDRDMPGLWIETDVASEALGYSHIFLNKPDNLSSDSGDGERRVTALIKAEHGIGGTFITLPEPTAWHGVTHTEVGQMNLRKFAGDYEFFREHELEYPYSIYKHSVESMASIPALQYFTNETFDELKQRPNDPVWYREAWYLAQLAWCSTCSFSPNNIIFSGKILSVTGLIDKIWEAFKLIKASEKQSIPNYSNMHRKRFIRSIQESVEAISFDNPAIRGALCFAAMTTDPTTFKNHIPDSIKQLFKN